MAHTVSPLTMRGSHFAFCSGVPYEHQIAATDIAMDREIRGRSGESRIGELLDDNRIHPEIAARTAVLVGNLRAKQPRLAALLPHGAVDDARLLPAVEMRGNFRSEKAACRLAQLPVFLAVNRPIWKHPLVLPVLRSLAVLFATE